MSLLDPLLRSFASRSSGGANSLPGSALLGCLDFIGPCLITGWVLHPRQPIRGVILQAGDHRLALTQPTLARPDVAQEHGGDGLVGFTLAIDEQLPLVVFTGRPSVVAIDDQGRVLDELVLRKDADRTERILRAALDPQHRGLQGHWDGIDPQTGDLVGWAHHGRRGDTVVWLQRSGEEPRPVPCTLHRNDILENGEPRACGFRIPWPAPPDLRSEPPLISLDPGGLLPLPAPA